MKNIEELLLSEGISLSRLSEDVLRKLQTLRLGRSENFTFTPDNVLGMAIQYTLPTAENVMDNVLTACRLVTREGRRLIDLIIESNGHYNFYPSNFFYYTESVLNNVALEPLKNALEKFQNNSFDYKYFARIADEATVKKTREIMPKESYLYLKLKREFDKFNNCNVRYPYLVKVVAGLAEAEERGLI